MSLTAKKAIFSSILIVLAFFPSLFAELSSVDDIDMYKWLSNTDPSLKDFFFPQVSSGTYYRPLIGVSYLFDKHIWFLDTRLMHLDNLVFHLFNALLVYYLALKLLPGDKQQQSNIPLVSSLLFGLHPLTVESVAWISGRTDIMAGTFVLLSTVFLLKFRATGNNFNLLKALLVLIPGLLIKETPMAFLLGAIFILSSRNNESVDISSLFPRALTRDAIRCAVFGGIAVVVLLISYSVWPVLICGIVYLSFESFLDLKAGKTLKPIKLLAICAGIALPVWSFFLVRSMVFASSISSIGRTMKLIFDDLNYACQTFYGAAGFYVSKFFLPLPLNFAIREIDPLYNLAGVLVFFFCLYAIRCRSIYSALFLSGVCLFLPALPLSLGTVTWTAYAERYVYISTAFWSLPVTAYGYSVLARYGARRAVAYCTALLILVSGIFTFQRNMLWRTNLGLLGDTVVKSPGFKLIRADYMAALMGAGDLEGAKNQYLIAQAIPSVGYMESFDINRAMIYGIEGKYVEAEKLYKHVLKKTAGKSAVAYSAYIGYLQKRFNETQMSNDDSALAFGDALAKNMEKLYELNKDPMQLYRAGQLYIALGGCKDAQSVFAEAVKVLPENNEYFRYSSHLVTSLSSGHCIKVNL